MCYLESFMKFPDVSTVEKAKNALPVRQELKYNMDFLTEATKLLSTAWNRGEDMSTVKMNQNRQEKVRSSYGTGEHC